MPTIQLVEQHLIHPDDSRWTAIDAACFLSKNLYNAANYRLRQEFIFHQRYIPYPELANAMRQQVDFCALPRKVSQQVLRQLDHDWQSFFAALAEWTAHPEKFTGRPHLPHYKHKTEGRNLLVYTAQAISRLWFKKKGVLQPSQLPIEIVTRQTNYDQLRIVPNKTHYLIEVVYTREVSLAAPNPQKVAAVDIGLNALATVTFNQPGMTPLLVNGRPLKAINQLYNKRRAELQAVLSQGEDETLRRRLAAITDRRNRKMKHELHCASRAIINVLIERGIGRLVIGKNDGWKQGINLGKRTNQNFVSIPHAEFIEMLTYKAQMAGIEVVITEESYTSKCSFLDLEPIGKRERYAGERVHRGLFRTSDGRTIQADVNGSYNIMRKVVPECWTSEGIAGAVVHPTLLPVPT
jgi:putative transposase